MNVSRVVNFWKGLSEENWRLAQHLFKTKYYTHALFYCHLSLEAILKSRIVEETGQPAPYLHDLLKLTQYTKLKLDDKQKESLSIITTFNVRARYDDVKLHFHKKATKDFTKRYIDITKKMLLWIREYREK